MAKPLDGFLSLLRRRSTPPTKTLGAPGTAIYGGFIQSDELNPNLSSQHERYKTYSEILANTTIVAAGTRYFLNLAAKAEWSFQPSDADTDGKFAELTEKALTEDPATSWRRVVRRAAMYRFYGFSVQEWTAKRADDGSFTYGDIAPRAQLTIEKWDTDETGKVLGVVQRSPQTSEDLYLPRPKLMYVVDDTLSDSPDGLGLFRHLVSPAQRVARYEQLEGLGFEHDLRGIPIGRGPFTELSQMEADGTLTSAQRAAIEAPMRQFIQNHTQTANLGLLLDSITYEDKNEGRPSPNKQWDIDLLKGSATSFAENAAAIERLNREMARILGVEQLMLGSGSAGSHALSQDKTNSFFLLVDGALAEIRDSVENDLIDRLFKMNGWPEEMKPTTETEAVRFTDIEQIAATLRDMASAGAVLDEADPVVDEVRDLMGVSRRPPELVPDVDETDDSLLGAGPDDSVPEDGQLPESEEG